MLEVGALGAASLAPKAKGVLAGVKLMIGNPFARPGRWW
jgi:hypothetical protein